jgi:tRNA(Arg) A34 adenosine deaminase TadA
MTLTRRQLGPVLVLPWLAVAARATETAGPPGHAGAARGDGGITLGQAMARARALRDEASRLGDQPFGAVVWRAGQIVGEGPSRVVQLNDPTAHAETEAIRDAARRLGTRHLVGCVLVSTSRPCRMCEAAAGFAQIERMVHGQALTDAGRPS